MPCFDYKLNSYKTEKIGDKILLISLTGSWAVLSKEEYTLFRRGKLSAELFKKLEDKGIILTEKNENQIINDYKKTKIQLFQGTSLHIIVVTLRCNEKCVYCHAASMPVKTKGVDMDIATAKKTVDFIFQSPSKAITIEFQGGEPLINFKAVKTIIEYAKEKNSKNQKDLRFSIVTNLSLMTDDILDFFIKHNVGICTSLDGPKYIHDKNRPMTGASSYDLTVKWIKKITSNKKMMSHLNALLSTTKFSLPYAKEIVDQYRALNIKKIWFRPLNNLGAAKSTWNKISYSAEEYLKFWKTGVDYVYEKSDIQEMSSTIILKKILTNKNPMYLDLMSPCGAAIGQLAYNYNGDIFSCDEARMINEDIFKLGDINNSYKEVLTSPKTCNLISASVNDTFFCNTCPYQPYCGLCPVCTYGSSGKLVPLLSLDMRCKILKGQFKYIFEKLITDPKFEKKTKLKISRTI